MAQADDKNIAPHWYDEAARAKIRAHIEKVAQQRTTTTNGVDFEELFNQLEVAAAVYGGALSGRKTKPPSAEDAMRRLGKCETAVALLRSRVANPEFGGGEQRALVPLLAKLQLELEAVGRDFRRILSRQENEPEPSADVASVKLLKNIALTIGHDIFGPQIGNKEGPLVEFLRLALDPVLRGDTPSPNALRIFARQGGGQLLK